MTKDLTPPTATALPMIFFSCSSDGELQPEHVKIIDRHGRDVTRLFDPIKEIGFSHSLQGGFAKGKLRFGKRDWVVDCPSGLVNKIQVKNRTGYDFVEAMEPNTFDERYPPDGRPEIEITFDAEWIYGKWPT